MATRRVELNLPAELVDALDEVASRYATTTTAVVEQALIQLLLQQPRKPDEAPHGSADDLEALLHA